MADVLTIAAESRRFALLEGGQVAVVAGSHVRRLTPRECERLQGFPDDWTRWRANGSEIADGPRYRMCGNAVTVNVAEWIGRRICEERA